MCSYLNAIYQVSLLAENVQMFGLTVLLGRARAAGNDKIVNSVGNQTFTFTQQLCAPPSDPAPSTHHGPWVGNASWRLLHKVTQFKVTQNRKWRSLIEDELVLISDQYIAIACIKKEDLSS